MKIIKWTLLTLIILVMLAAGGAFLLPSTVHVERSMVMDAPLEIVHAQVNNLKNWTKWSPWYRMDSTMKIEYNGTEEGPGAAYKWASNHKKVGSGEMTITSSAPDSIGTAMNFMENGIATGKFIFTRMDSSTKVSWVMESDMGMNPVGRIFGLFMDKMLGPEFEKGLANLKEVAEAIPTGPKKYHGHIVEETELAEKIYIIKRDSIPWDSISSFYMRSVPAILAAVEKAKLDTAGSPASLFFKWDTINRSTIMAAAIPVKEADPKIKWKGFERFVMPGGMALRIAYYGGYHGTGTAHMGMTDYIDENGFIQLSPVAEEYVTGPGQDPDSTKWLTNVYYRVK